VLRSSCRLARIALERNRIDLPVEMLVPRDDAAFSVQLDDLAADRDALFLRAVPVGVIEDRLDPVGLPAVARCFVPPFTIVESRLRAGSSCAKQRLQSRTEF
jgi:hypothetical protein